MGIIENLPVLEGEVLTNEPLANYTSWKVGGPAEILYKPKDLQELSMFLQHLPDYTPIYWLGLGSNLLVRDRGLAGVVIATQGKLNNLELLDNNSIKAGAGVACAQMARFSARQSLQGAEFLAGIPGTIGGALALNAGCFGGETWDIVSKVDTMNRRGEIITRTPEEYSIAYRQTISPAEEWFINGYFNLQTGDKDIALQNIRELLDRRSSTQPTNIPTCGSVFRNPPGDYSARLIEFCDLKNYQIGGAKVSAKHANFIENTGDATAADIEKLISHVAETVEAKTGIALIREVHIVGQV